MKKILCGISIILGIIIAIWTTYLQGMFFSNFGISPIGAIAVEPLLIITSFFIGYKITTPHKTISVIFITILTVVSFLTISSMFLKNSFIILENTKTNIERVQKLEQTENIIQNSLIDLTGRGASSKSTIKIIDRLQEQQKEVSKKLDISELEAIIGVMSKYLRTTPEKAILIFSIFISLVTVFAPSFLFFTTGVLLKDIKKDSDSKKIINKIDSMLTDKQKDIYTNLKDNKSLGDISKKLNVPERIIKSQISRINSKLKDEEIWKFNSKEDNFIVTKENDLPYFKK